MNQGKERLFQVDGDSAQESEIDQILKQIERENYASRKLQRAGTLQDEAFRSNEKE